MFFFSYPLQYSWERSGHSMSPGSSFSHYLYIWAWLETISAYHCRITSIHVFSHYDCFLHAISLINSTVSFFAERQLCNFTSFPSTCHVKCPPFMLPFFALHIITCLCTCCSVEVTLLTLTNIFFLLWTVVYIYIYKTCIPFLRRNRRRDWYESWNVNFSWGINPLLIWEPCLFFLQSLATERWNSF